MGYIYQIVNNTDGKIYVGSTSQENPRRRWWRHRNELNHNKHHCIFLQRAWNKHGKNNFEFVLVEKVSNQDILKVEQKYLDERKEKFGANLTYNTSWLATCGPLPTKESIQKQILCWETKCKIPYSFTSPDGIVYENIRNLRKFSREHGNGLTARTLGLLHSGRLRYHKGWVKTGIPLPVYALISPTNQRFSGRELKPLCVTNKINYKMIYKYCLKMNKPYKGWFAQCLVPPICLA